MARQGRLCQPKNRPSRPVRFGCCAFRWAIVPLVLIALIGGTITRSRVSATDLGPSSEVIDAWFRVQWSSSQPMAWRVRIAVESPEQDLEAAEILAFENHCTADASTGAFRWTSERRELAFDAPEQLGGGVVRIRVRGPRDALLSCRLAPSPADPTASTSGQGVRVRLGELVTATTPYHHVIDPASESPAVEWAIERTAGDALQVALKKATTVYAPREEIPFSLSVRDLAVAASSDVTIRYALRRVADGEIVSDQSWDVGLDAFGSARAIDVAIPAPEQAGVYELRATVEANGARVWTRFRRRREPIVEAGRALLVTASDTVASSSVAETPKWRTIQTISPAPSRQWTVQGFVPATTSALLSTIQPGGETPLAQQTHAGEPVSALAPAASCQFKLPVDRLHVPHIITLRYPAAAGARLRVDLTSDNQPLRPQVSFAVAEDTAQIDHLSWASHSFVHYPGDRRQTIRLTNLDSAKPVLLHSIQVTAGPDRLTRVTQSSASDPSLVALSLPSFGWVEQLTPELDTQGQFKNLFAETKALHRLHVATLRLADYVRAAGMNGIVVPANQGGRMWFETSQASRRYVASGESAQQLDIMMQILDSSGLRVIVGLEPTMRLTQVETAIRAISPGSPSQLRDERDRKAAQRYQPLDPVVQEALVGWVSDAVATCNQHACFAGVSLDCNGLSHLMPVDGEGAFSSEVLHRFGQTLAPAAASDAALDVWRRGEGRAEFNRWLLDEQRMLLVRIAAIADSRVLLRLPSEAVDLGGDDGLLTQSWPEASSELCPVIEHRRGSLSSLSDQRAATRQLNSWAAREPDHDRAVALAISERSAADGTPTAVIHDAIDSDLGRLIDRLHPGVLLFDVSAVTGSLSPQLADGLRAIAKVPLGQLHRVPAIDAAAQPLRLYQSGDAQRADAILAINVAPWAAELEIASEPAARWHPDRDPQRLSAAAFGTPIAPVEHANNDDRSLPLPAGAIELVRCTSDRPTRVEDWTSRPAGGEAGLARIKTAVTRIVESLSTFSEARSYPALANSGFEQPAEAGVPGWLTAQYPRDAVRLDHEAAEGEWSVMMLTDSRASTRTWLVSETFDVPASGRLAVALACRSEAGDPAATAAVVSSAERAPGRIRIAVEGTQRGEPVRFAAEIAVPRDGRWQSRRVVLEMDALEVGETQSLRLAIDSLSPGRVWVDDIRLYDWFPLESERNELQGQSFLAVQGLQRGNLAQAARLIRNDWARYLLTLGPAVEPRSERSPSAAPERAPGMAERIRSWLPRPIRF